MSGHIVFYSMRFAAAGKGISSLMNRYGIGRMLNGDLHVTPHEFAFLLSKGKVILSQEDFHTVSDLLSGLPSFFQTFAAYFSTKSRGLVVSIEGTTMTIRRNRRSKALHIQIAGDMEQIRSEVLMGSEITYHAVVDMDGDMTLFSVSPFNVSGKFTFTGLHRYSDRIMNGRVSSILDQGYSIGSIRLIPDEEIQTLKGDESSQRMLLYNDLKDRGLLPKSGFKYGADFRVYMGPDSTHAECLVSLLHENENWSEISRLVRVSNGVRKQAVFSMIDHTGIKYVRIGWIRDLGDILKD